MLKGMTTSEDRMCAFCSSEIHPDDQAHDVTSQVRPFRDLPADEPPWLICDFCAASLVAMAWLINPDSMTHERKAHAKDMAAGFNILRADITRLASNPPPDIPWP